jgi:alkylated DNA repair dioxygenase AlkB
MLPGVLAEALGILNANGASVEVRRAFLAPGEAARWLARLQGELAFDPPEASRMRQPFTGRWVDVPRLQAGYGEPGTAYQFSGIEVRARPWTRGLAELRALLRERTGFDANYVLANLYRDGRDCMGWHADDERDLGPAPEIHSLSLGAARDFQFRRRGEAAARVPTVTIRLEPGSLLVMRHPTNANWKHQLPRRGGSRPERVGLRLNLTWRRIEREGRGAC